MGLEADKVEIISNKKNLLLELVAPALLAITYFLPSVLPATLEEGYH